MQRPDEISGAGKVIVLRPRSFERVEHLRVVIGAVRLRALAADVERHIGVDLSGVLNRGYFAEHEAGRRIDLAFDAGAVIGLDALEIEIDELRGRDLTGADRAMYVGNGPFLKVEGRRGLRRGRELRRANHHRSHGEHG